MTEHIGCFTNSIEVHEHRRRILEEVTIKNYKSIVVLDALCPTTGFDVGVNEVPKEICSVQNSVARHEHPTP